MSRIAMRRLLFLRWLLPLWLVASSGYAEELKLEARLIWGTNDEKSPDPSHKRVDEKTAKTLADVFKWRNYFVVNTVTTNVASRGAVKLQMSRVCQLEIKELQGPQVEVSLIGKGNKVTKTVKPLKRGELFTLGGADKNDTAWFIVVSQL
jgi:hypothetical protein